MVEVLAMPGIQEKWKSEEVERTTFERIKVGRSNFCLKRPASFNSTPPHPAG